MKDELKAVLGDNSFRVADLAQLVRASVMYCWRLGARSQGRGFKPGWNPTKNKVCCKPGGGTHYIKVYTYARPLRYHFLGKSVLDRSHI